MGRPLKIDRPVNKTVTLPTSLVVKVELELYSELQGRVPFGAWQQFLQGLIEKYFAEKEAK